MDKAIIAIAGCKNSGKSSLCKYIQYIIARIDGSILEDPFSGEFTNKNLTQVTKDASKNVYISKNGSFYNVAHLSKDPPVEVQSFASPIKEMCVNVMGLPSEFVYGSDEEKNQLTPYVWENLPEHIRINFGKSGSMSAREIMQVIGTDIFRNYFSNNIWVEALVRRIKNSKAEVVLIDDLRFNSEAEILMKHETMFIHLQRMWGLGGSHLSENGLDLNMFSGYPHYVSIPDVDIVAKNNMAFNSIKEYFNYVATRKKQSS